MTGPVPAAHAHIAGSSPWTAKTRPATTRGAFRACARLRATRGYSDFDCMFAREPQQPMCWGRRGPPLPRFFANEYRRRRSGARFSPNKTDNSIARSRRPNPPPAAQEKTLQGKGCGFPENESMWCAPVRAPHVGTAEKLAGDPPQFSEVRMGAFTVGGRGCQSVKTKIILW
jgi:hypothetical protein